MKIQIKILTAITIIAAAAFAFTGCSKKTDGAAGDQGASAVSVDTAKLEAAFASAEAATKTAVEPVIAAIKSADYSGALTQLQALGAKIKLTDEQQAAVNEVIANVQKAIADAAAKAAAAIPNLPTAVPAPAAK